MALLALKGMKNNVNFEFMHLNNEVPPVLLKANSFY